MKFIGNYFGKKSDIVIDPKFKSMTKDELILTANTLKDANDNLKESLNELTKKNEFLKETLLNKEKKSSELKNFVKDIRYTLFSSEDIDSNNEKNKELNDFIYDQYFLYGGLEEEEINDLNQIKMNEDNWADNKDFFVLKQKIIERNYQELFKNISISEELNKLFPYKEEEKEINDNNIKEEIKLNEKNIINNNENKEEKKIVKKEIKKHKIKKENKKKDKVEKEKKGEKNIFDIDKLNPNKDKKINYKLEDFNFLEEDNKESLSLNQLSDEKNKKWDDDDDED